MTDNIENIEIKGITEKLKTKIEAFADDKNVISWIKECVKDFAVKNGENHSNWELFKLIIQNTLLSVKFLEIFLKHGLSNFITLIQCTYDEKYKKALESNEIKELIAGDKVKNFLLQLENEKDNIHKALSYIMKLPENDDNSFIDQQSMRSLVTFLKNNKDTTIKREDITAIIKLLVSNNLPTMGRNEFRKNQNNLQLTAKILEISTKLKGVSELLNIKKALIANTLAEMPINGITGLINENEFCQILDAVFSDNKLKRSSVELQTIINLLITKNEIDNFNLNTINLNTINIRADLKQVINDNIRADLKQVINDSSISIEEKETFINNIDKATDLPALKSEISKISQKFAMKMTQSINDSSISIEEKETFINNIDKATDLPALKSEISKISQKFAMKMTQSGIGLMKTLPISLDITKANKNLIFSQLFTMKSSNGVMTFTLNALGEQLSQFGFINTKVKTWSVNTSSDSISSDVFERNVLGKLDLSFITDILDNINPNTLGDLSGALEALNTDKPLLFVCKLLDITSKNVGLQEVLIKHAKTISEVAANFVPEESKFILVPFIQAQDGESKEIMRVILDICNAKAVNETVNEKIQHLLTVFAKDKDNNKQEQNAASGGLVTALLDHITDPKSIFYKETNRVHLVDEIIKPILYSTPIMEIWYINGAEVLLKRYIENQSALGGGIPQKAGEITIDYLQYETFRGRNRNLLSLTLLPTLLTVFNARQNLNKLPENNQDLIVNVIAEIDKQREGTKDVNLQAISRSTRLGLLMFANQDVSNKDLSRCIFNGFKFNKTNFNNTNLQNAHFIKCNFDQCSALLEPKMLAGTTFDYQSFKSLTTNIKLHDIKSYLYANNITIDKDGETLSPAQAYYEIYDKNAEMFTWRTVSDISTLLYNSDPEKFAKYENQKKIQIVSDLTKDLLDKLHGKLNPLQQDGAFYDSKWDLNALQKDGAFIYDSLYDALKPCTPEQLTDITNRKVDIVGTIYSTLPDKEIPGWLYGNTKVKTEITKESIDKAIFDSILGLGEHITTWALHNNKSLSELLNNKEKLQGISRLIASVTIGELEDKNLLINYIDILYINNTLNHKEVQAILSIDVDQKVLKQITSNNINEILTLSNEIFKKTATYCLQSGRTLDDILQYKDVLDGLDGFSDALRIENQSLEKKDSLNKAIEVYNALPNEMKHLINDKENHAVLASVVAKNPDLKQSDTQSGIKSWEALGKQPGGGLENPARKRTG